jgi:hypothetical protein
MSDENTASLERIIRHGNRPGVAAILSRDASSPREGNWVVCTDGFKVSVVAGANMYCTPRPSSVTLSDANAVDEDYPGPYTEVEVGYPSERPEPWACTHNANEYGYCPRPADARSWQCYSDDGDTHETVFGYVPVQMVRDLIALHGGEA